MVSSRVCDGRYSVEQNEYQTGTAFAVELACNVSLRPQGWDVNVYDHRHTREAIRWSIVRNPTMPQSLFEFISRVLLLEFPAGLEEDQQLQWRDWVLRFQQLTGPVTAKGMEDTSFYRYYPLLSLNEVGGELATEALSVDDFHRTMVRRADDWPFSHEN